jgi:hypothetical protein
MGEFDRGERELWWPDKEIDRSGGGIGERGREERKKKGEEKERVRPNHYDLKVSDVYL